MAGRSVVEPPHSFAEANQTYFDQRVHSTIEHHHPNGAKLARRNVAAMRKAYSELFDEESTEVLDYACGTGMLSQALCPYVKSVVGVDISQESVDEFNAKASNQGLEPNEMRAICADLKGKPDELGGALFDVVVCCASYHHFPSIEDTTRMLVRFLKPGGALLVTDIRAAPDDRVLFRETHHHIVPHTRGFTEDVVRHAFEDAGLVKFEMRDAFEAKMTASGEHTQWFIARGLRPVDKP
ncbi:S-adenosyl-L-methionine-dependent methyltransferase [Trametes elegans]|nr:S-adenosyl-L-methionine-dependent methyltransferase [Trametes elegans]